MRRFNSKLSHVGGAMEWLKRKIQFKAMRFEVWSYIKIHFSEIQTTDCISPTQIEIFQPLVPRDFTRGTRRAYVYNIYAYIVCVCVCVTSNKLQLKQRIYFITIPPPPKKTEKTDNAFSKYDPIKDCLLWLI